MSRTPMSALQKAISESPDANFYQMILAIMLSATLFLLGTLRSKRSDSTLTIKQRALACFYLLDYFMIVANRFSAIGLPSLYEGLWVCSLVWYPSRPLDHHCHLIKSITEFALGRCRPLIKAVPAHRSRPGDNNDRT